jgi:hypothetical protein
MNHVNEIVENETKSNRTTNIEYELDEQTIDTRPCSTRLLELRTCRISYELDLDMTVESVCNLH